MNKNNHENEFQISDFNPQIKKKSAVICVHLWLLSLCLLSFPSKSDAQVRPVYDYGAIGLGQLLKRLNNTKSVMHIGAHPDDEDSGLLAYLARGENARTAYLSLTRGDGGQNIIGNELGESLGVIRTEELLQARRLDGAEQFFTRAYDYGFSKTLDEAKQKWDEKIILCDAVRAVRYFRPLVVISRFSGTPADGHGQHQFAGYIAPLAVKAAADANQCTDSGMPWQVLKFYVSQGFRSTEKPTLSLNTGEYDFLLGRSYFEIAMEGRSQHKTQEQGVLELRGERFSGLNLIETKVQKVENERSLFDGIDTSITGLSEIAGKIAPSLGAQLFLENALNTQPINDSIVEATRGFNLQSPQIIVSSLIKGLIAIRETQNRIRIPESSPNREAFAYLESLYKLKEREFSEAIRLASGIQMDALTNAETVTPDESVFIIARIFYPAATKIKVKEINLRTPAGWQVSKAEAPQETNQGFFRREVARDAAYFNVKIPPNARLTAPYWLENPRKGDLFEWQSNENQTLPFQKLLISADVKIEIEGTEFIFNQPVEYRYADDIRGEVRRNISVVPALSVTLDRKLLIVPKSEQAQTRRVIVNLTNYASKPISGSVGLNIVGEKGIDWRYSANSKTFNLKTKGEKTSVAFDVTIPAKTKSGNYHIYAQAMIGEALATQEMNTISYPHIQTQRFYTRAETKVEVFDLKVVPLKVGYITGSGDEVPEAIRQMGLSVDLLNETDLTSGDLSKYQTIVVGIRAFQVRQDLIANNQRLLDYARNGGVLIVQYQRPEYETLLPFPAKLGARVADENARVTILDSASPVFNFPNRITEKDFEGWVQERNLYAFSTFDPSYKPLLETHDANEPENKGGLVVAQIGKGKYVYCSYAFFRQLPAGVPGAYRIFANLLSLK
jgi:LmbE family N-acetylglucosaminyl deacetylase